MSVSSGKPWLPLSEASKFFPGRPHRSSVWRFAMKGVRGVRLETIVCGGRRYTSEEAILRFIAATTAAANGEPMPVPLSARRRQEQEEARAKLREVGIDRS